MDVHVLMFMVINNKKPVN